MGGIDKITKKRKKPLKHINFIKSTIFYQSTQLKHGIKYYKIFIVSVFYSVFVFICFDFCFVLVVVAVVCLFLFVVFLFVVFKKIKGGK